MVGKFSPPRSSREDSEAMFLMMMRNPAFEDVSPIENGIFHCNVSFQWCIFRNGVETNPPFPVDSTQTGMNELVFYWFSLGQFLLEGL